MTPFELRSLCESSITPLAFAQAFSELTEADRKKLSKTAQEIFKEARAAERAQFGLPTAEGAIARLAILACCPGNCAKQVNGMGRFGMFPHEGAWTEAVRRILLDRRPLWAADWIAMRLDEEPRWPWSSPVSWNDVRELMQSGVIERPTVDGYTRLLASVSDVDFNPDRDGDVFDADVWRLFTVDTTAFDAVPEKKKALRARAQRAGTAIRDDRLQEILHGWPRRLYERAQAGTIDRDRLIDETLNAVWHAVRPAMQIGLLRFLEILEPTDDETAARQSAYRELLRSNLPAVVGMALQALTRLQQAGRLDAREFLEAAPAVFNLSDKNRPGSALSLIDHVAEGAPAELPFALTAVSAALNHESVEIQEQAVKLLAKWKEAHAALDLTSISTSATSLAAHPKRLLDALIHSPQPGVIAKSIGSGTADLDERRRLLRERLAALPEWVRAATCLDGLDQALETGALPPAFDPEPATCPVLSGTEPIEPIQTVDELIDAVSHLFEVVDGSDDLERIVEGIMRLGGDSTDDFEAKTEELRHTKFSMPWGDESAATLLLSSAPNFVGLISWWLGVRAPTDRRQPWGRLAAFKVFDLRMAMLITRFKARRFGPVLATPTHRGGWIDPRVFVDRLKSISDIPWQASRFDLIGGLLRLAPDFRDVALESAADLPLPFGPIVRYALGGPERPSEADQDRADEWLAAGRTRQPRAWLEELRVLEIDEREPDGITRAVFRFEAGVKIQESEYGRWSARHEVAAVAVSVAPRYVSSASLETRPTVALAACLLRDQEVSANQNWQAGVLASYWPANPEAILAVACSKLMARMDDAGLIFEAVPAWMSPLQALDRGWSQMARTALWLGLLSRNDQSRGTAIDALIEGIADGRADTAALAETLLQIASGGWIKLNRLADSLREVTRTSTLAERVVAEILDRLIASWNELPRDGHHVLALQVELLSNLQHQPSPGVRDVLAPVKGSGKASKLAQQLRTLIAPPVSTSLREAALEAAAGRLARAERILQFFERHR
jgi:hypothetical protein